MSYEKDLPASCSGRRLMMAADRPRFEADDKGSSSEASYIVPLADRAQFLKVVGGTPESTTLPAALGGGTVTRNVPLRDAEYPNLYAWKVSFVAYRFTPNKPVDYKFRVYYRTPTWGLDSPFVEVSGSPSGRTVPFPAAAVTFSGSSAEHPINDPGKWIGGYRYDVKLTGLGQLNLASYWSIAGTVNQAAFAGAGAQCVLYNGPSFNSTTTIGGVTSYSVTHSFEVSALSWNGAYTSTGQYLPMVNAQGLPDYTPADWVAGGLFN